MESATLPLSKITLIGDIRGTDGDLKMLMDSMKAVGMLQPLVLNSKRETVAGRRRYRAAERLGWKKVPVVLCANLDEELSALRAERDENTCRVSLTRVEMLAIGRKYAELENPEAAQRKVERLKQGAAKPRAGKLPAREKGRVRDKVGEAIGMGGQTFEHMQSIVLAAQKHPDRYLDLGEQVQIDKQPVDPLYQEFKTRQEIYDAADGDQRFADIAEKLTESRDTDAAQKAYQQRLDEQSKDELGQPIPESLMSVFNDTRLEDTATTLEAFVANQLAESIETVKELEEYAHGLGVLDHLQTAGEHLKAAYSLLLVVRPHAVCPRCQGAKCEACDERGWLTQSQLQALTA